MNKTKKVAQKKREKTKARKKGQTKEVKIMYR
jgi:hypothetical protein